MHQRPSPPISKFLRLTLKFITVRDFTLPIARLFIDVKRQSTWACDLFKTRFSAPDGEKIGGLI